VREIPRVAVVPTHNRPVELERCLRAIGPQCDAVIVIDNASTPPVEQLDAHVSATADACNYVTTRVIRDEEQPPNLSRLWNVGLACATASVSNGAMPYDVAVLNDDAVPPPGWWDAVSRSMRAHGAAAASSDPLDSLPPGGSTIWHGDAPMAVVTRLTGWAFILRGELGLRFDERLRWWYGDDLISLHARERGGLVHVGGVPVPNVCANQSTVGALAEQAGRDRATFVQITGRQPW
jgi:glycosyltransferase involved in cell wall biosynthesis